jgi:hypothetical protein
MYLVHRHSEHFITQSYQKYTTRSANHSTCLVDVTGFKGVSLSGTGSFAPATDTTTDGIGKPGVLISSPPGGINAEMSGIRAICADDSDRGTSVGLLVSFLVRDSGTPDILMRFERLL